MALSTWLAVTLPEEQAEPEDSATPLRSNFITIRSAVASGQSAQVMVDTRRVVGDDFHPGYLSQRLFELALQRAVVDGAGQCQLGGEPQPGDPGHVLGAGAAAAFLLAVAAARGPCPGAAPCADALRPAEFMSAEAEVIHAQRPHGQRQLTPACTASVCTLQPAALAIRATSGTGCTTPVSLLTSMREISPGSLVFSRCSGCHVRQPFGGHGKGFQPGRL